MKDYLDKAIVLRKQKFSEADILLTVFTKLHGKRKVLARGSRKIKSKFIGHAELLSLVKLNAVFGRSFDIATFIQAEKSFYTIKDSVRNFPTLSYISEITDSMTVEGESHPEIFQLLMATMSSPLWEDNRELIINMFLLALLRNAGFAPQLDFCVKCEKREKSTRNFSNYWGGIICRDCHDYRSKQQISNEAIKELKKRAFLTDDFLEVRNHNRILKKIDAKKDKEIRKILDGFVTFINEKKTKSSKFFKKDG